MGRMTTATGKTFDCEYFNFFAPAERLYVRVQNSSLVEVASVFGNPAETVQLYYGKEYRAHYTRVIAIVPEGDAIRVTLGKE